MYYRFSGSLVANSVSNATIVSLVARVEQPIKDVALSADSQRAVEDVEDVKSFNIL